MYSVDVGTMPVMALELVGPAEVMQLLGVSRTRTVQITSRDDFPVPLADLTMGKVWDLAEIRRWATASGRELHDLLPRPSR